MVLAVGAFIMKTRGTHTMNGDQGALINRYVLLVFGAVSLSNVTRLTLSHNKIVGEFAAGLSVNGFLCNCRFAGLVLTHVFHLNNSSIISQQMFSSSHVCANSHSYKSSLSLAGE